MTPAARIAAAAAILDQWLAGTPLEQAFLAWSRKSRFAGSRDRAALRDLIFDAARRRRSYAVLGKGETGRGLMLGALRAAGQEPEAFLTGARFALSPLTGDERAEPRAPSRAERLDVPDWLLPRIEAALGPKTEPVLMTLRDRAPVHLRVNLSRTSRTAVQAALAKEGIATIPHPEVKTALEVTGNERQLQSSPVLSGGLVELQDAHSQAVVLALLAGEETRVLDYCAGGGGKALALADLTDAEIVAHDIDFRRMRDLPARAARAGHRIRMMRSEDLAAQAPFDLVFCDAPCSGSGAWRRDPAGKWRLTPERLSELQRIQAEVLEAAAPLVAPGGRLAYVTCSILREENETAAESFLARHPDWHEIERARLDPSERGDGFFRVIFQQP